VVGNAERGHAGAYGFGDQFIGRTRPVRFIGVRVKIDQRKRDLDVPV
jgi:hypothetical protein